MALTISYAFSLVLLSIILALVLKSERSPLDTSPIRNEDLTRKKLYTSDLNLLISSILFEKSPPSQYSLRDLDFNQAIPDMSGNWTSRHSTVVSFVYMNNMCSENMRASGSAVNLDAKWVTFEDSPLPWIVSRCTRPVGTPRTINPESDPSWSYALSHLSRMPLSLREHVRVVMVAPIGLSPLFKQTYGNRRGHSSMSVSESRDDIVKPHGLISHDTVILFGEPSFGTWIHEFSHAVDLHAGHFSSSRIWSAAVEKDECVVDGYASNSAEEVCKRITDVIELYSNDPSTIAGFCSNCYSESIHPVSMAFRELY
jgi:hypothetical protein